MTDIRQYENGVSASLLNFDTQVSQTVRDRCLAGGDDGSSFVKKIGTKLECTEMIQREQSTYIGATELVSLLPG